MLDPLPPLTPGLQSLMSVSRICKSSASISHFQGAGSRLAVTVTRFATRVQPLNVVPQPLSEPLVALWLLPPASSRARSTLLMLKFHQCRVWLRHQSTFVWRCPCYTASRAYIHASCRPDANQGCSYLLSPLCLLPGCRSGARVSARPQRSLISFCEPVTP